MFFIRSKSDKNWTFYGQKRENARIKKIFDGKIFFIGQKRSYYPLLFFSFYTTGLSLIVFEREHFKVLNYFYVRRKNSRPTIFTSDVNIATTNNKLPFKISNFQTAVNQWILDGFWKFFHLWNALEKAHNLILVRAFSLKNFPDKLSVSGGKSFGNSQILTNFERIHPHTKYHFVWNLVGPLYPKFGRNWGWNGAPRYENVRHDLGEFTPKIYPSRGVFCFNPMPSIYMSKNRMLLWAKNYVFVSINSRDLVITELPEESTFCFDQSQCSIDARRWIN